MDGQSEELLRVFQAYLPKYLSPDQKADLLKFLKEDFPLSSDAEKVYSKIPEQDMILQGDALEDIPFSNFLKNTVSFGVDFQKGVLISNTCDVSSENARIILPFAAFSMVYELNDFLKQLKEDGISPARIESFVNDLKGNRLSSFMYLPSRFEGENLVFSESFLRFDRIANVSTEIVKESYDFSYFPKGNRLFSFSNYGFFLFLTKLSVHFCRIRENVIRSGF